MPLQKLQLCQQLEISGTNKFSIQFQCRCGRNSQCWELLWWFWSVSSDTDTAAAKFLSDSDKQLSTLNKHPLIKQLFMKFNTPIPSSAAVERLFSQAACILTKRRNRLSDDLFQQLLLLKSNRFLVGQAVRFWIIRWHEYCGLANSLFRNSGCYQFVHKYCF